MRRKEKLTTTNQIEKLENELDEKFNFDVSKPEWMN